VTQVRRFQISQREISSLEISVAWDDGLDAQAIERARARIVADFKRLVGDAMRVDVVETLTRAPRIGEKRALVRGLARNGPRDLEERAAGAGGAE